MWNQLGHMSQGVVSLTWSIEISETVTLFEHHMTFNCCKLFVTKYSGELIFFTFFPSGRVANSA